MSFGTRHKQDWELEVVCAKGRVNIVRSDITVTNEEGSSTIRRFTYSSGVTDEVAAFAEAVQASKADPRASPAEALLDLKWIELLLASW